MAAGISVHGGRSMVAGMFRAGRAGQPDNANSCRNQRPWRAEHDGRHAEVRSGGGASAPLTANSCGNQCPWRAEHDGSYAQSRTGGGASQSERLPKSVSMAG